MSDRMWCGKQLCPRIRRHIVTVAALAVLRGMAQGASDADQCLAGKLKTSGKYSACLFKADALALKTGSASDYTSCAAKLVDKFDALDARFGSACSTAGGALATESALFQDKQDLLSYLSAAGFSDNGDGTLTDSNTGLMWETKGNFNGDEQFNDPRDGDNTYTFVDTMRFLTLLKRIAHMSWRFHIIAECG